MLGTGRCRGRESHNQDRVYEKNLFSIKEKNEFKFRSSHVASGFCIG